MHECIRLAVVALNEAEALHRVEELDRSAGLLTSQLTLRAAGCAAAPATTAAALDCHRFALDAKVRRGDTAAAVDERELERLAISKVGKTCLLDRRDMNKHVLTAIVADDEAEALLRIEEFDDAFAFANDLRRHSATAATSAAAAESTAAAAAAAE